MSDEPINILSRKLSKFFTNNNSTNFDYTRAMEREAREIAIHKSEQKSFSCICLSHFVHNTPALSGHFPDAKKLSAGAIKKLKIKIWFVGDDIYMNDPVPNPFLELDPNLRVLYRSIAKEAITTKKYSNISPGDFITVENRNGDYYVTSHDPSQNSKYAGDTFEPQGPPAPSRVYKRNAKKRKKKLKVDLPCEAVSEIKPGSCYNPGPWTLKQYEAAEVDDLTFEDFITLSKYFSPILDYIETYESGTDKYEANNIGVAGKTVDPKKSLGKLLTEMTVEELRGQQLDNKGGILLATGRYQIIPKTLGKVVATYPDTLKLLYNEKNQDAMAVFLILIKRPRLGRFLMFNKGTLGFAGNSFAFEWASSPMLATESVKGELLSRGQSPYNGIAGNYADPRRIKGVEAMLKETQTKLAGILAASVADRALFDVYEKVRKFYGY